MSTGGVGGPVWVRKIRTMFRRLDTQGHGYLMVDDFLAVASGIFSVYPKMEPYKNDLVVKTLVYVWYNVVCAHLKRQQATSATVNEATFVENMQKALQGGPFLDKFYELFSDPLFEAMDQDDDKKITGPEFHTLMINFASVDRDIDLIFKLRCDGNKWGLDQFRQTLFEFFTTDDPKSKINRLWGPLLEYKRAEEYGTLDCGPVWEGKMRTMFRRFDVGESMKLRCHDLLNIGQFLIQRNHMDRKKSDAVLRHLLQVWVKYLAVDKNGE